MRKFLIMAGWIALVAAVFAAAPARATFHLWTFDEVFSNADGTVQFIEMTNAFDFEQFVSGHPLTSTTNSVTPGIDLPAVNNVTAGHHMLFATAGFGTLAGGVTPDYIIPAHFFNPAGDTLNWAGPFFDTKSFGPIPTDGVHSLLIPADTSAINSPTNFAGPPGFVNLTPPTTGDYNHDSVVNAADYTVWRDTFGQTVTARTGADGNGNGMIDNGDYDFWKNHFGNPAGAASGGAAVPEPSTLALALLGLLSIVPPSAARYRARRRLAGTCRRSIA